MKKNSNIVPKEVKNALEKIAKGVGVAVAELWSIFVRQYLVKGVTCAFVGLVLSVSAYFLKEHVGLFALLPATIAVWFYCNAILLIGNPKYYALEDLTERIQKLKSGDKEETKSYTRTNFYI